MCTVHAYFGLFELRTALFGIFKSECRLNWIDAREKLYLSSHRGEDLQVIPDTGFPHL